MSDWWTEDAAAAPAGEEWWASDTPANQPVKPSTPLLDRFLENTSVGRVLDAFGQGAKDGWGEKPLGLSDESDAALRKTGLFKDFNDAGMQPLRMFNEALIRPAAVALDGVFRGVEAGTKGVANATGQVGQEYFGLNEAEGRRLTRDTLMLAETLGVTTALIPMGIKPRVDPVTGSAERAVQKTINEAQKMDTPGAVMPATEELIDKAGNINLNRIQAPDDVKNVIRDVAVQGNEFNEARRGTMSLKETEDLASAIGMSAEDLTKRKVGEAFNAEEAVAARNLLVQSATKVRDLAAKMHGGADTDVLAFQEAMTKHLAIQEQVAGMTAEAGRALSAFRIAAKATGEAQDLGEIIKSMGGRDAIGDIARKINELDTPEQVSQFLMDARKAKLPDQLLEAWINGLLSGPQTHVSNVVSNTMVALMAMPETAVAAGIGAMRRGIGGGQESVYFGEVGARAYGILQGSKDGLIAGWRTYKTEIPSGGLDKLETARPRAIPSAKVTIAGKEFEIGGKQVRIPGRALMAEDEVFKAIAYRQELNALAYRQAVKEGHDGEGMANRVAELIRHPDSDMVKKARDTATYQTFTKELGPTGKALMSFVSTHPALRVPFTFIRTPVNILKYAGERTPLAVLSKNVRAELRGEQGEVARDTQMARIAVGTGIMTAAYSMAAEGLITGTGPKDGARKAVMYEEGWQPQSIKIGDMYYSYARFEPLAMLFGAAATVHEVAVDMSDPEVEDVGMLLAASIAKNMTSKTWMRGPAEALQAATDPERYGQKWIQRTFSSMVPTALAQVAREEDPYLRDARNILDAVKTRIPGKSQDVPVRRSIWGEPIKLEGSLGPDMLSPIYTSRVKNDPVNQELIKLEIWPAALDRKIRGVELKPDQYDAYQRVAGRLSKTTLDQIVKQPAWLQLPDYARREVIVNTIQNTRETARNYMLMQYPQLLQDSVDLRVEQINGVRKRLK